MKLTHKIPTESGYYWAYSMRMCGVEVVHFVLQDYVYSIYFPGSDENFHSDIDKGNFLWSERIGEPEL